MAGIKVKFNLAYSGTIPESVGDRYYGQDMIRDYQYLLNKSGNVALDLAGIQNNFIMQGAEITAGSVPANRINIKGFVGYVRVPIEYPNNWGTLPPGKITDAIWIRVEMPDQNDILVTTYGAILNGSNNYVKVKFNPTSVANSYRQRAKKAGLYYSEFEDSFLLTIDNTAPTVNELSLGIIAGNGIANLTININTSSRTFQVGNFERISHAPFILNVLPGTWTTIPDTLSYNFLKVTGGSLGWLRLPSASVFKNRSLTFTLESDTAEIVIVQTPFGFPVKHLGKLMKYNDMIKVVSDGTEWKVLYAESEVEDTGWISRSLWANMWLGNPDISVTGLVGTPVMRERVYNVTRGIYATIKHIYGLGSYAIGELCDSNGFGSSGLFNIGDTLQFLTSGATGLCGNATKNQSTRFWMNTISGFNQCQFKVLVSQYAQESGGGSIDLLGGTADQNTANSGITIHGARSGFDVSTGAYIIQTGSSVVSAFQWIASGSGAFGTKGSNLGIGTFDWFYRIIGKVSMLRGWLNDR